MQKKLIALAIAGLSSSAFAQSNVTISGQLKGGWEQYKISNSSALGNNANGKQNMFSDQTSSIVLKGEENLGNGLSAIFQIDNRFTIDTGNTSTSTGLSTTGGAGTTGTLGSGNTWVGIKSASFGEVKLGRTDLHYNESERIENGAKSLSQQALISRTLLSQVDGNFIGGGGTSGASRTSNVLFWDSPNWGGITARLAYSTNPFGQEGPTNVATGGNADKGSAWNGVVRYENGPLKTGVSYYRQTPETPSAAQTLTGTNTHATSTRAWAGYTIAGFSFGLIYDRSKVEAEGVGADFRKRTAWAIPLSYTVGNHGFYASYGKAGDHKEPAGTTAGSGAKQYALGYDYSLSKRTSVGVNYAVLKNDTDSSNTVAGTGEGDYRFANIAGKGTATSNNEKASQIYVGLRHAY